MLNHLVCGNFQNQLEDDIPQCSSPKSSKSKRKVNNNRDNNPYASRGLDKFSTLLSELDQRRKKVYSQMNPHDISFVRFTYSSNDDFVPIVVKVKNNNQKKHKSEEIKVRHLTSFSEPLDQKHVEEKTKQLPKLELCHDVDDKIKVVEKIEMLKRPSFYVPVVLILILLMLTVFGRSFATVCTCVVWYIVPILKDSSSSKITKKKDYVNEGLSSPISDSKASNDHKSSGKHSHQKSW
ncbi:unnamed protein product [Trifolium pratense]|uniref:Uncharacterized protein n=1 Tax=Trifolium pratense TaxID=57577 RepID=A0ACB0JGG8_TRIPR|nr:unnamed protein product [Trifolium pratense]